eukprot:PhM_4_TR14855/c1_g1_i1/m.26141
MIVKILGRDNQTLFANLPSDETVQHSLTTYLARCGYGDISISDLVITLSHKNTPEKQISSTETVKSHIHHGDIIRLTSQAQAAKRQTEGRQVLIPPPTPPHTSALTLKPSEQ